MVRAVMLVRLGVVAGIHGNRAALSAALRALAEHGAQRVVSIGELAGGGPDVERVMRLLRKREIACVRGPIDELLGSRGDQRANHLRPQDVKEIVALPERRTLELEGSTIVLCCDLSSLAAVEEVSHSSEDPSRPPKLKLRAAEALAARLFQAHPQARVVVSATFGSGFAILSDDRLAVGVPFCGLPPADDPRAPFAIISLDDGAPPSAQLGATCWKLDKHVRRTQRAVRKERVDPAVGIAHLGGLLGRKPAPEKPHLRPDDAGSVLLAKLLGLRSHAVYAGALAPWPDNAVEHVHDLRVATRRFREALAVASHLVDPRAYRRANRRARALGRALGQRRIADVFLHQVTEYMTTHQLPENALASLVSNLEERRAAATEAVDHAFPPEKLLRHGLAVRALAMQPIDEKLALSSIAARHLGDRIGEVEPLLASIEDASAVERHHELRIALKHLRYASEILSEAYPAAIDPPLVIAPLRELQDALGDLNDTQELLAIARALPAEDDPPLRQLCERLAKQASERYSAAKTALGHHGRRVLDALRQAVVSLS